MSNRTGVYRPRQPAQPRLSPKQVAVLAPNGVVLTAITDWYCPNCGLTDRTNEIRPHTRLHPCAKMAGLSAPLFPLGTKAKVYSREREDYIGRDLVRRDNNGRPIMSIVTVRDDGQDAIVFAPTAVLKAKET